MIQKNFRSFRMMMKRKRGELVLDTEKKDNHKLGDELFELGNVEREKRKSIRTLSLSKLDIDGMETKNKKLDLNDPNVLEELMENKNLMDETIKSMAMERKKKVKKVRNDKPIEERLINYGDNLKKKISEMKFQKMKEEENQMVFMPNTNTAVNKSEIKFNLDEFLNRMSYFKNKYDMNMEEMKNKRADSKLSEYTFKPKLSRIAEQVGKRTVNDLYNWKYRKEQNLIRRIKEKKDEEDKKIEEECSKKFKLNVNSELILLQKMERSSKIEINDENSENDLWPVQMQKTYFEKK